MVTFKFNVVTKIALTALFTAITIILTRLISIQNFAPIQFIRISLGPSMLIFAGLVLGPIYGGIAGLLSDVIGFFLFDTSGFGYNPLLSITYLGYGLLPGLLIYLFRFNKKYHFPFIQLIGLLALDIFAIIFFTQNNSLTLYGKVYELNDVLRYGFIGGTILITFIYFSLYFLFSRTIKKEEEKIYLSNISAIVLITLVLFQLIIGGTIKAFMFEVDFLFLFASQVVATMIEMLLGTYLVFVLYIAMIHGFPKYIKNR